MNHADINVVVLTFGIDTKRLEDKLTSEGYSYRVAKSVDEVRGMFDENKKANFLVTEDAKSEKDFVESLAFASAYTKGLSGYTFFDDTDNSVEEAVMTIGTRLIPTSEKVLPEYCE